MRDGVDGWREGRKVGRMEGRKECGRKDGRDGLKRRRVK